jgi:tripartite-type tricarboxylate transporter receptor subunit TctC
MLKRTVLTAALALAACAAMPALAQDKPPLKIVVGFPPGGSADLLARLMAEGLKNDFSSVIVENRPGAGGRIALGQVKRAPPDGQTVIILPSGPMVLFPHVYKKLDYDAVTDFTPISLLAHFQFSVVAGAGVPVKNVKDMIARAKAEPGRSTYGTPGQGTLPHFMGCCSASGPVPS